MTLTKRELDRLDDMAAHITKEIVAGYPCSTLPILNLAWAFLALNDHHMALAKLREDHDALDRILAEKLELINQLRLEIEQLKGEA